MKLEHNMHNNERIFPSYSTICLLAQLCRSAVREALIKYIFNNKKSSNFCRSMVSRSMVFAQPQGGCELGTNKGQIRICLITEDNMLDSEREYVK